MPDITITLATLISVVSVSAAVFFGIKSKKRADDEDVTQISDVQEKMDIKPRTDIDFEFYMKQTPKTN